MKKILLQSGHQNTTSNCIVALRGSTGSPGEAEFNVKIRDRLSQILLTKKNADGTQAFELYLKDANFNCDPHSAEIDYALALAIHYDANIYGKGGGFVDYPDPSVDGASVESKRIKEAIESLYFNETGIVNVPSRSNANTKFYYMWSALSAKTPCVIIECGVGQDAHDKVILSDIDRVCNAIARGICKAFNVPFDQLPPPPPPVDWKKKYEDEAKSHIATKEKLSVAEAKIAKAKGDLA